ncbi:MAG: hypothetical protein ACRDCB_13135 [Clostridium sp.]|uniref:hypothetical protein n=1 Tax=Clostridium TaxID=1485 RepID=UPI00188356A7|nr:MULTISPECIES: hypothetical protein [Clostridium]MCR6514924.1 hypothetical protein [Clostridium sp. LY3-2]
MKKNAIQNVECSLSDLKEAKADLEQAVSTVEKASNKEMIQKSLDSVCNTIKDLECTINNYQEK